MHQERVTIIAEVGTNHNGNLSTALELIDISADCGADIVKFQSFLVDDLLAINDPKYNLLKKLEIPLDWYGKLIERCVGRRVKFLSTATNFTTLSWMEELCVEMYKVASCNITHQPLIDRLIEIGKPIIISTGLASLEEILDLAKYFDRRRFANYSFLHCVSKYPARNNELKLGNITTLKQILNCPIGYSDHSNGILMAPVAVALGASIIEKHITLSGEGIGMDHDVAVTPKQFRQMVDNIRDVESASKIDFSIDKEQVYKMRRSLHAALDLNKGIILESSMLQVTRPEDGLPPKELINILGKRLTQIIKKGEPIRWDILVSK